MSRMEPTTLWYQQNISFNLTMPKGNYLTNKNCAAYAAPFNIQLTNKRQKKFEDKFTQSVVQPDNSVICTTPKLD